MNSSKEALNAMAELPCEACRIDAPRLTAVEIAELLTRIPQWRVEPRENVPILIREYSFKNFAEALQFTTRVGEIAEAANHHPALLTEWGSVTVNWWTHKIKGLHQNDFIMAAKTDQLYQMCASENQ